MATYSNNTTIKFLQAVTLTGTSSYTVPANSYAILSVVSAGSSAPIPLFGGGGSSSVIVDGNTAAASTDGNNNVSSSFTGALNIHIPAGKVISTSVSGKASAYALLTVFQNTP